MVQGESHKVPNLTEGKKYKYRVRAENMYGVGDPLETTKPHLAKNPFGELTLVQFCFNYFENYVKFKYVLSHTTK